MIIRNRTWICLLSIILLNTILASCHSEEEIFSDNRTGLQIFLEGFSDSYTRATPADLGIPDKTAFNLAIQTSGSEEIAYKGPFKETVLLKEGIYNLSASYGDNPIIALDAPFYQGSVNNQSVKKGEVTSVSIACNVANSLLTVNFNDESLKKIFDSYYVSVFSGDESVELHSSEQSAYFRAGSSIKLIFHAKAAGTGNAITYNIPEQEGFNNIPAAHHVQIQLGIDESSLPSGVGISIEKLEITKVSIEETLPLEFLPKPKFRSNDFVNNELSFAETEKKSASIHLDLASPLQDLKLKFNSTDPRFAGLDSSKEYFLSNPADKETIESLLGIILPTIGTTEASINLSPLVPHLLCDKGNTVQTTIEIDAKANNRWTSEGETDASARTYTLACQRPEFKISILPGNIWSKEFTINECEILSGDAPTIKENLKYQYREKTTGTNEWQNAENLKVQFAEFPANKQYEVRALYRDELTSEIINIELETPEQIPNSDMEDWYIETKKKSGTWPFEDKTYYTFHPYTQENSGTSWWATNNDKAQGGTYALGIWYEGCFASCVSYTEDAREGTKAALIYLSGCGDGYANTSGTYVGGAMVGSLFIGSYNSGIAEGHTFASRPTSMSFWYKYKPYNSDAFKVIVSLKNGSNTIASGTYEPTPYSTEDAEYQSAKVDFVYTDTTQKATTICVQFLASNKTELSQSDFALGTTINYPVVGNWTVHMGSILKIDDIALIFDK